ncbi:MAG: hypothetical protein OXH57_02550, partial [Ekhidna sp.]|nr:hypothetical protein [Ekhidna sp.]
MNDSQSRSYLWENYAALCFPPDQDMNTVKSNIANRTIFCHDNLEVLRGINSACIDLIYLD